MGIIGRLLGFLWRRWADYNSLMALLDLFDAKTWIPVIIAWVAMIFIGSTNTSWSPQGVVVAAFVVAACVAIIIVAVRLLLQGSAKPPSVATATAIPDEPINYIDASVAFFDILENSDWSRDQKPIEHPVSDWLTRRLDDEIHNRLYQNRLKAWGKRCLNQWDEGPEGIIPADEWKDKEIEFTDRPRTCAVYRAKRNGVKVMAFAGIKFSKKEIYGAFPPTDEEIPLYEAAIATYERIRNHEVSIPMEVFADSPDDILIGICKSLTEYRNGREPLLKLFGNKPPSGVKERVYTDALNRYEFVVDGKTLTFREPTGRFYYENLTVKAARLEEAIQKLMENHQ
jgi:hypothetical protein